MSRVKVINKVIELTFTANRLLPRILNKRRQAFLDNRKNGEPNGDLRPGPILK